MKDRSTAASSLRRRDLLTTLVGSLVIPASAAAQSRDGTSVRTRPASTLRFRIDLPEKDWRLVAGGVSTLGSLAYRDDGVAVVIEHSLLQIALTADELDDTFVELEVGELKEREPTGTAFAGQIVPAGTRRMVTVDYQRPGTGGTDQIRVYVLLQSRHMYRLICVAPSGQFARHLPAFQAMCGSFTPLGAIG